MLNRSVTNENDKCDVAGSHLAIVSCYGHWRWNANAFRYSVELDMKPHENKNQSAINFHGRIIAYARSHRIGVGGVEYCCSGHENAVLFYFVHAEVAILIEFKLNWLQWSLLHNNSNNKRKHKQKQKRKERLEYFRRCTHPIDWQEKRINRQYMKFKGMHAFDNFCRFASFYRMMFPIHSWCIHKLRPFD